MNGRTLNQYPDESYRPYIFVTNGGGKTEEERCIQLSNQLQMEVSPGQFICGHTPMRELAQKYHTVLVVGGEGEKCREVALGYGFQDVIVRHPLLSVLNRGIQDADMCNRHQETSSKTTKTQPPSDS